MSASTSAAMARLLEIFVARGVTQRLTRHLALAVAAMGAGEATAPPQVDDAVPAARP